MNSHASGVSVIVCCYNSAQRLQETIKHLAQQQVPALINWEVIIVNNASTDATYEIALKEMNGLFANKRIIPLNCIEIAKQGGAINCITWNIYKNYKYEYRIKYFFKTSF